jgi:hypothetical protein
LTPTTAANPKAQIHPVKKDLLEARGEEEAIFSLPSLIEELKLLHH